MTETCRYLMKIHARAHDKMGDAFEVHECALHGLCTHVDRQVKAKGVAIAVCETCDDRPPEPVGAASSTITKANFAYYTATNQSSNTRMIEAMIRSARKRGIQEDFHTFTPGNVNGAVNHPWEAKRPWKHMQKVEIARDHMASLGYEYVVWLDSDTWFTRHPGDLMPLLRDNAFWIQGESELTAPKLRHGDWWGCPIGRLPGEFRRFGCNQNRLWTTNGGMFIMRSDAIPELSAKAFEVYDYFLKNISRTTEDETPLAFLGHLFVEDPDLNRKELTGSTWFCDWMGRFKDVEPVGGALTAEDWLTGETWPAANPAIIHAMRAKNWMRLGAIPVPAKQAMGTSPKPAASEWRLGDQIETGLSAIGVTKDRVSAWIGAPCGCAARQEKMNKLSASIQRFFTGAKKEEIASEIEAMTG